MDKIEFDENRILDALNRSGYLFESEISKKLSTLGYFVESNQVVIDKFTGKSREIDLIAEYEDNIFEQDYSKKCYSKIKFAFEIKNTSSPVLVLTEYQNSINDQIWESLKEFKTIPSNLEYFNYNISEKLIYNSNIYTQYCSFQEKKGSNELMALHPDNIHSGIQKITQYCQEKIGHFENDENNYLRHFLYIPILLISGDLYELKILDNLPKIFKTEETTIIYNFHHDEEPTSCLIKVLTKDGLDNFLKEMLLLEKDMTENMIQLRSKQKK
ncbi:hypothetical protein BD847_0650 [Flavobacterium cutihirudinis]|uniref:Uncharacterized protein n=1 Tax=Flavobacterium cutihirudinis TaxID=1265740 RepID=A0A3D9G2C3_9FLAO|nr:hypothetical protein [Flavobacterium cutihirudinis]RED26727.1 hypothetical protein BD847_0650 [Flavobacterium cutihirudinis]